MSQPVEHPVDFDHLDRYTGGDPEITQEILRLFEHQCQEMLGKLEELVGQTGENGQNEWRLVTHTLKGAARGVGAFGLAEAAAFAEESRPTDRRKTIEVLARLKGQSEAVYTFIEEFLTRAA